MSKKPNPVPPTRLLRAPAVCERLGIAKPTLYEWMRHGQFPRPAVKTRGVVMWTADQVEEWIADRVARTAASRRKPAAARA